MGAQPAVGVGGEPGPQLGDALDGHRDPTLPAAARRGSSRPAARPSAAAPRPGSRSSAGSRPGAGGRAGRRARRRRRGARRRARPAARRGRARRAAAAALCGTNVPTPGAGLDNAFRRQSRRSRAARSSARRGVWPSARAPTAAGRPGSALRARARTSLDNTLLCVIVSHVPSQDNATAAAPVTPAIATRWPDRPPAGAGARGGWRRCASRSPCPPRDWRSPI